MRYGIVSDVHANIQAWKAVLRDMKKQGVDIILCLGDVIGYGPNPAEVLDSCYEHVDYFLLGNHDAVVGNRLDSDLFNDNARFLIEWTRDQLADAAVGFFGEMPLRMEGEGFICAHGELAVPGRFGYIYKSTDAVESFTSNDSPLMFVGHTHFPAKIALDLRTNSVMDQDPKSGLLLPHERYLINVGSVGDPRDGVTEASYCIFDQEKNSVIFRRVPFDIESFRRNLLKTQLPVTPFFIQMHDGQKKEAETIKDMAAMEEGQAVEARNSPQKISEIPDEMKKRRKKLTFSTDTVAHTKYVQARDKERAPDKKGAKVLAALAGALVLIFLIIILAVKSGSPAKADVELVNTAPVNERKYTIQKDSGDFDLLPKDTNLSKDDIRDGVYKWNSGKTFTWTVGLKKTGWFEVRLNHNALGNGAFSLKAGDKSLKVKVNAAETKTKVGLIQLKKARDERIAASFSEGSGIISEFKSITFKYAGKKKPNPFGDLDDVTFAELESMLYPPGWSLEGAAFNKTPINSKRLIKGTKISGVKGEFVIASINSDLNDLNSAVRHKGAVLTTPFVIKHQYINILASGGDFATKVVVIIGKDTARPQKIIKELASSQLKSVNIDVSEYYGDTAVIKFVDDSANQFIAIDRVIFTNNAESDFSVGTSSIIGEYQRKEVLRANSLLNRTGAAILSKDLEAAKIALKDLINGYEKAGVDKLTTITTATGPLPISTAVSESGNKLSVNEGELLLTRSSETKEDTYKISGTFNQLILRRLTIKSKPSSSFGGGSGTGKDGAFTAPIVDMKILKSKSAAGRYVRISRKKTSQLILREVEVLNGSDNLSNKMKTSQSSGNFPSKAVDGVGGSESKTSGEEAPYWEVDLGSEKAIDRIKVHLGGTPEAYTVSILNSRKELVWQSFIKKPVQKKEITVSNEFSVDYNVQGYSSSKSGYPFTSSKEQSFDLKNSFTMVVRFKAEGPGSILSKNKNGGWTNQSTGIFIDENSMLVTLRGTNGVPLRQGNNSVNVIDGKFHTLVSRYVGGTLTQFMDGTKYSLGKFASEDNKDFQFQIGTNAFRPAFKGQVEYTEIYRAGLSDEECISISKALNISGKADFTWPTTLTVKELSTVFTPQAPISLAPGDKYEISMKFDDTANSNLLGSFTIDTSFDKEGLTVREYVSQLDQLSLGFAGAVSASFKADVNKEITLSLVRKDKKVISVKVKLLGVDEQSRKLLVLFNNKRMPVDFASLSQKEISSRIKNREILQSYINTDFSQKAAELSNEGKTYLQKLIQAGVKKLPESINGSVYGRFIEVWELKTMSPSSWTVVAGGRKAESKLYSFTQLYPKFRIPELANPPKTKIYLCDLGSDIALDKIQLTDVKGDLISLAFVVRDSMGKITWMVFDQTRINKNEAISFDPVFAKLSEENLLLNKPYTVSDKDKNFYGINDGMTIVTPPFSFTTGGNKSFPKSVTFDLGRTQKVNALRFVKFPGGATREMRFEVSTDGTSFKEVGKYIFDLNKKMTRHILSIPETEASHIRVIFKNNYSDKNGFASIYHCPLIELEAYHFE